MTQKTRMFMHSNGVKHKYKLKSEHQSRHEAEKKKDSWKSKYYNVRIIKGKKNGKMIHKVWAFAMWD